jgi:tetratricopeptide (TPR) repeat protein
VLERIAALQGASDGGEELRTPTEEVLHKRNPSRHPDPDAGPRPKSDFSMTPSLQAAGDELEAARALKDSGNAEFAAGRYAAAIARYESAAGSLGGARARAFRCTSPEFPEDSTSPAALEELWELLGVIWSNVAECHLRQSDAGAAAVAAGRALQCDAGNTDARLWRAQARLEQGEACAAREGQRASAIALFDGARYDAETVDSERGRSLVETAIHRTEKCCE